MGRNESRNEISFQMAKWLSENFQGGQRKTKTEK